MLTVCRRNACIRMSSSRLVTYERMESRGTVCTLNSSKALRKSAFDCTVLYTKDIPNVLYNRVLCCAASASRLYCTALHCSQKVWGETSSTTCASQVYSPYSNECVRRALHLPSAASRIVRDDSRKSPQRERERALGRPAGRRDAERTAQRRRGAAPRAVGASSN